MLTLLSLAVVIGGGLVAAADPLKDDLGTGVELLIHLDFTGVSWGSITSQSNTEKAKLTQGAWKAVRAAYTATQSTTMAPYGRSEEVGCWSAADMSSDIMEYIPGDGEAADIQKIDASSSYNKYIFAVGKPYTYPGQAYPFEAISMGENGDTPGFERLITRT